MLCKCYGFVALRTGSIVSAIIGLLCGVAIFVQSGVPWSKIVQGIFYFIAYGALLFGAIKYNEKAVLFNLLCTAILIVLAIVFYIIMIAKNWRILANNCVPIEVELLQEVITCDDIKSAPVGMSTGILIVSCFLIGYFWVSSYNFYKELKGGSANPA